MATPTPPYGIIARHMKKGNVVPFLGAGASLYGRPKPAAPDQAVAFEVGKSDFLPSGMELAHILADDAGFPQNPPAERDNLAKVASWYVSGPGDRPGLREQLREVFCRPQYKPNKLHTLLASLEIPPLIVTTNYDTLIEQAFEAAGKPYHLVVYPADQADKANAVLWWEPGKDEPNTEYAPNTFPLKLTDTAIIYKMHGTVHRIKDKWDNFVITEEDYVDFLSRMTTQSPIPNKLMAEFRRRRFLFLGYSMNDWNLRVLLTNMRSTLAKPVHNEDDGDGIAAGDDQRAWGIQRNPSEVDTELWKTRGVTIYNEDLDTFVDEMKKRLQ